MMGSPWRGGNRRGPSILRVAELAQLAFEIALKDHGGTKFFVFHQETIEAIKQQLAETYPPPSNFTVSDFRVLTGSTRKYVIPMLEYFDRNRITIRQGNYRSLSRIEN